MTTGRGLGSGLAYKVEDRSVLLPLYKRALLDPLVARIPRRVHPNALTHAGHVFALAGAALLLAGKPRAWAYAAAALGVQLYNFCDNADGAHARRTNQTSATGELLDHGLDALNSAYIGLITAASVDASDAWTVALAMLIPAAVGVTCWEQAETGVFHLGRLNQIEALIMLSIVLAVSATFGVGVWERIAVGPWTMKLALLVWTVAQTGFGILHGGVRVLRARDMRRLAPFAALVGFEATVGAAYASGAASAIACIVVAIAGNVAFGLRMLATRLAKRRPAFPYALGVAAIALFALAAWKVLGRPVGFASDIAYASASVIVFGGAAIASARDGARRVAALDRPTP